MACRGVKGEESLARVNEEKKERKEGGQVRAHQVEPWGSEL